MTLQLRTDEETLLKQKQTLAEEQAALQKRLEDNQKVTDLATSNNSGLVTKTSDLVTNNSDLATSENRSMALRRENAELRVKVDQMEGHVARLEEHYAQVADRLNFYAAQLGLPLTSRQ